MSQTDPFDPALKALLDADRAPSLSGGFADRVLAATEGRAPALPPLRRAPASRWRSARRVALGLGAGLLLSSAAAATGMLQQVGIVLPQPVQKIVDDVAQKVTGRAPVAAPAAAPPPATPTLPPVVEGPIDTPEELDTVFSRADARRPERVAQRRAVVDQRIDAELDRRRAAGLPVPTAQQEAALRQRLADARARSEAEGEERREALREELRQTLAEGQPLTRETLRQAREEAGLAPAQRLSPEQRSALRQRLAERRGLALQPAPTQTPETEIAP
ncbi:hypothetical protein [Alteraurantiacibacter buctensis]|uniref:Uncharacterized protein n=1 Tax=Alteraurantiacibacter buctensis TaxID=1503981 RepID=A0A844Z0L3_9SPHN|nr:hypothetical protein [Alteraurantiacibacter buctensis]MXO72521.1 hypothetical protein [Alteraurantiacibacter buctensis]